MTDGFVDIDRGVQDSIKDLVGELRKDKQLRLVAAPEQAQVRVLIVARRAGPSGGGAGVVVGNLSFYSPTKARAIDAVLRAGDVCSELGRRRTGNMTTGPTRRRHSLVM